jgi:hypothetical protein
MGTNDVSVARAPKKVTIAKQVSEQLNRMLVARSGQAKLLNHNLEKGLGNEQVLRDLLTDFLPRRYGVAKGKIVNSDGEMSKQLDVIIYDAINCPILFIDENRNQILPIEGVFTVVEVKTTLTSKTLGESFENLASVYPLAPRTNLSRNELVTGCPPYLQVFAFNDDRTLHTISAQFAQLSKTHAVDKSCSSYSEKSPAYRELTGLYHLVSSVDILNKGSVHHMLDGSIDSKDYEKYSLGMFLMGLLDDYENLEMPPIDMRQYLNWIMVASWRGPASVLGQRLISAVRKQPRKE